MEDTLVNSFLVQDTWDSLLVSHILTVVVEDIIIMEDIRSLDLVTIHKLTAFFFLKPFFESYFKLFF